MPTCELCGARAVCRISVGSAVHGVLDRSQATWHFVVSLGLLVIS